MTQCLYGSHITGHASSMPGRSLRAAMSWGGVAGGADDALLGHLAVVGKVVAGHHGEGPAAEAMTRRERGEDEAKDGGFRAGGVDGLGHVELWVVEDALVGEFEELVVALVEGYAVAVLGD